MIEKKLIIAIAAGAASSVLSYFYGRRNRRVTPQHEMKELRDDIKTNVNTLINECDASSIYRLEGVLTKLMDNIRDLIEKSQYAELKPKQLTNSLIQGVGICCSPSAPISKKVIIPNENNKYGEPLMRHARVPDNADDFIAPSR
jgi:hypothetical protein